MCNSSLQIDDLLDMICSITEKQAKIQDNLRLEVLLKCTYKWLDNELKVRQLNRKRKWMEMMAESKKSKCEDFNPMEERSDDDLLAIETSLLSVLSILRRNNCL